MSNYEPHTAYMASVLNMTSRKFKQRKRAELRAVAKAFDEYRFGCAGSPAYPFVEDFENVLNAMMDEQSVRKWGQ